MTPDAFRYTSAVFSGLIETVGTVVSLEGVESGGGARLTLHAPFTEPIGASVAVNGVCLTVQNLLNDQMQFEMVAETMRRTNLGDLLPGSLVNLERPLTPTSRMGGHFVQGHVDTTAELIAIRQEGNGRVLAFRLHDSYYMRYVVPKGSIAVDGISLTVVDVDADTFSVWIVPYTWTVTNLRMRQIGDRVNIETDILARYVERLLEFRTT